MGQARKATAWSILFEEADLFIYVKMVRQEVREFVCSKGLRHVDFIHISELLVSDVFVGFSATVLSINMFYLWLL